jgi:periplasmic protein TonB
MKKLRAILGLCLAASAAFLASCRSTPMPPDRPAPVPSPAQVPAPVPTAPAPSNQRIASQARNLDAYKTDFARALYAANRSKIFSGILPPLLKGVTVVSISIDANGTVLDVTPMRVPSQAKETLGMVREMITATRVPVPQFLPASAYRAGRITFNETFLFTDTFDFQVHTLSEGQRRE